jgi:uncharacterized phage-associated protein
MTDQPLDPRALANYILIVRTHFGYQTTNLELQKISYFAYAKYLQTYGEKLCEGYFEAWEHGPVHPLLYRTFKKFGANPITQRAEETNLITGEVRPVSPPSDPKKRTHIAETVLQLRNLSASQLRAKSHAPRGPWHMVWESAKNNLASQVIIPDNVIREGFGRHMLSSTDMEMSSSEETNLEDHPPNVDRSS